MEATCDENVGSLRLILSSVGRTGFPIHSAATQSTLVRVDPFEAADLLSLQAKVAHIQDSLQEREVTLQGVNESV
jgi:hypothetical protein